MKRKACDRRAIAYVSSAHDSCGDPAREELADGQSRTHLHTEVAALPSQQLLP